MNDPNWVQCLKWQVKLPTIYEYSRATLKGIEKCDLGSVHKILTQFFEIFGNKKNRKNPYSFTEERNKSLTPFPLNAYVFCEHFHKICFLESPKYHAIKLTLSA